MLRETHRRVFLILATLAAVVAAVLQPPLETQLILIAPLAIVLGLPHGALDYEIAKRLWPLDTARRRIGFVAAYLGLAAILVLVWIAAPLAALAAFLIYSSAHFSEDWDAELAAPERILAGLAVVGAPIVWNPTETAAIFSMLVGPDAELRVFMLAAQGLGAAATVAVAVISVHAALVGRAQLGFELAALMILAAVASPLIYFAIYFCALHSPRHVLGIAERLDMTPHSAVGAAAPITALTILFSALCAALLIESGVGRDVASAKIVFIGLAALTVPHMALVDRFARTATQRPA